VETIPIRQLLERDPYREITTVIRVTDHDPRRVWAEMDEYVPTETVRRYAHEFVDALAETRQGPTERVCIWVSGFFGAGKSHFLKALGYLVENRALIDPDGHTHSSTELLAQKLGLAAFVPLLTRELQTRALFINLLDYDPQSLKRPTISRLVYRTLLETQGLDTEFWVAEWERELRALNRWAAFEQWVQERYGRSWTEERRLNARPILTQALVTFLSDRYPTEEAAARAIEESQIRLSDVPPHRWSRLCGNSRSRFIPVTGGWWSFSTRWVFTSAIPLSA